VAAHAKSARCAVLFLYKEVLGVELPWQDNIEQAKALKRLPVVLNRGEMQAILSRLTGTQWLIASLLYGTGMRIMECLRLRVQFARCRNCSAMRMFRRR
jgi:integrase